MSFVKVKENFVCGNCGCKVLGTGYTNHCPNCLWSRHVDIEPGDRANPCNGLLQPIGIETKGGEYIIVHQCQKCGEKTRCKSSPQDNQEEIILLSQNPVSIG
jgi:hypothetical protein